MEVEVELSKIIINEAVDQQIIVLKELDGERSFPIVIGMMEILAIDRRLKNIQLPRPMTHDLLADVIDQMGGEVEKVVINDLSNGTFYARLHISSDDSTIAVDSRPSDAIALGVGVGAPIFVDEQVFQDMQM
jgi:bifunctional DNase/RNase